MKKTIFLLFILSLISGIRVPAQDNINIGYCDGQIATTSDISFNEDNAWGHVAICLTPKELQPYVGGQITAINAGLVSRINLDSLTVWIKTNLNGNNICEKTVTSSSQPKILRGWNNIELDTPYTVNENETLYIGYSYKQKSPVATISYVTPPATNAFWAKLGSEASWTDMSETGTLSIEAVVTGNSLPQYDLKIKKATVRWETDGTLNIEAELRNSASKPIEGFSLFTEIKGSEESFINEFSNVIASGEETTVYFSVKSVTEGVGTAYPVTVSINSLGNGVEDENESNNSVTAIFSYQRKVFVEEFTTENCPNCPYLTEVINEVFKDSKYEENAYIVCHHSGYFTDWLTTNEDIELLWFYNNNGGTYAPAMMFDRHVYGRSDSGGATPVLSISSEENLQSYLEDRLSTGSSAYLDINTEISDDNQYANVIVTGGRGQQFAKDSRITIFVTEDNIPAQSQAGATQQYYHNHITRVSNGTWGEPIEWNDDNTFEYSFQFEISPEWNKNNLTVIATIGSFDENDQAGCEIENCEGMKLFGKGSGIDNTTYSDCEDEETRWFSINGIELDGNNLPKGIVLVKKGNKVTKMIVE